MTHIYRAIAHFIDDHFWLFMLIVIATTVVQHHFSGEWFPSFTK